MLVSTGEGRTTCAYFTYPDGDRILYATTHLADAACPPPPDRSQGYVWALYPGYEIVSVATDGSDLEPWTDADGYDAEATVCPVDGRVVFTSVRDGDLELYVARPTARRRPGSPTRRATTAAPSSRPTARRSSGGRRVPGPTRSWRSTGASWARGLIRPEPPGALRRRRRRLERPPGHLVRRRHLRAVVLPVRRPADLLVQPGRPPGAGVRPLGGGRGRHATSSASPTPPEFDGFPLFSPDGDRLAFASNRYHERDGETNLFVAQWDDAQPADDEARDAGLPEGRVDELRAPDRFRADVAWLADDAREGRGVGTQGLIEARDWLAERFEALGLEPAGEDGGFLQALRRGGGGGAGGGDALGDRRRAGAGRRLRPGGVLGFGRGRPVRSWRRATASWRRSTGSTTTPASTSGEAGGGAPLRAGGPLQRGRAALRRPPLQGVRRPGEGRGGAAGGRPAGRRMRTGTRRRRMRPCRGLTVETGGDAGLPVAIPAREAGAALFDGNPDGASWDRRASGAAHGAGLERRRPAAGGRGEPADGEVIVGAHYDHLGYGGTALPGPRLRRAPQRRRRQRLRHRGAPGGGSGARRAAGRARRDVVFVAFSGEESGILRLRPPSPASRRKGVDVEQRRRHDQHGHGGPPARPAHRPGHRLGGRVGGARPAALRRRWSCRAPAAATATAPRTTPRSTPRGVPVLHALHRHPRRLPQARATTPSKINAAGGARIARLAADVATELARRPEPLTYRKLAAPRARAATRAPAARRSA